MPCTLVRTAIRALACLLAGCTWWLPGSAQIAASAAADHVTGIYHQIAWQAVLEAGGPDRGLLEQPADRLARSFDPLLVELLLRQQRCLARNGGGCALDFDPFWDSQDPVGTTVAVAAGKRADQVAVTLRQPGGRQRMLTVQLVRSPAGWRISDIGFGAGRPSLKAVLQTNPDRP